MKRIGMVLDNPFYGDNRVINEARYLQKNGFEVFVLALNYGKHKPFEELDGIKIYRISISERVKNYLFAFNHLLPFHNLFWKKHLRKFVKKYKIEAIHAHDLYLCEPCATIAKENKLPLVLDLHENYPAAILNYTWAKKFPRNLIAQPKRWKEKEQKLLSKADRIIVLSEFYRDSLCAQYGNLKPGNFCIYPNVPDHTALLNYPIKKNPLPHPESSWLFYFGVITEKRGIYTAIDAVRYLQEIGKDIRLLLAGNVNKADVSEFQKAISDPLVRDYVLHLPWLDISEFPTYAKACVAGISPIYQGEQHDIGIANKVFQYMLMELPVVVSDSKAQSNLIIENGCGLVFKSGDATDLSKKIDWLINNPSKSLEMGMKGKLAIESHFNLNAMGQNLVAMYKGL